MDKKVKGKKPQSLRSYVLHYAGAIVIVILLGTVFFYVVHPLYATSSTARETLVEDNPLNTLLVATSVGILVVMMLVKAVRDWKAMKQEP